MKETTLDSIWEDEKDVLECRNCKATFSVARRKVIHEISSLLLTVLCVAPLQELWSGLLQFMFR